MRNWINLLEGSTWADLYWFWYNPETKELVHVEGTHATTGHYEMGFRSDHEETEDGIELDDDTVIKKAVEAGWVRGRFGAKRGGSWYRSEEEPDRKSFELSLQGQPDLVWETAKDIVARRRVDDLYLDFGVSHSMESAHLTGKAKNVYLQTGKVEVPIKAQRPVVNWAEMVGHELRQKMSANPENFELPFVKGSDFGNERHLTGWVGDLLIADAELKQSPSDPDEVWFMHAAVAPQWQGYRYGSLLASWGFRTAHALGKERLIISSFTDQGKERLETRMRAIADAYDGKLDVHFNSDGPRRAINEAYGDDLAKFWIDAHGVTHMLEPGIHHVEAIDDLGSDWLSAFKTGWVRGYFEPATETMNYCFKEKTVTQPAMKAMLRMAREWKAVAFHLEEAITSSQIGGAELDSREFSQYIRSRRAVAPPPREEVNGGLMRHLAETKHEGYQTWSTITDSYKGEAFGYCQAEVGERPIGYINFSIYQGRAHVKMIEVSDDWKRKGVATNLMKELAMLVDGDENIDWGEHTEDGMAFHAAYDSKRSL